MLTIDCAKYLPAYRTVTIYFLKSILNKEKKAIKAGQIKYLYAPQYESLSIKKIIEFAVQFDGVIDHFPEPRDWASLPRQVSTFETLFVFMTNHVPAFHRQWIINVAYTIIGDQFAEFVR